MPPAIRFIRPGYTAMIEDDSIIEVVQRYKRKPWFQVLFDINMKIGSGPTPEAALIDAAAKLRAGRDAIEHLLAQHQLKPTT